MFVQSESERMDLECVNLFGQMAYVEYGFSDEMLAILVHIDVVPKGDGWTMDAFAGIEHDGKIYGRGAIDNKGPAIASLFAPKGPTAGLVQDQTRRIEISREHGHRTHHLLEHGPMQLIE